jgi:hypothetical protein
VDGTNTWCGSQRFWNQDLVRRSRLINFIFKFCTKETLNKWRILVKSSHNRFCLMHLLMIQHVETSGVVFKAGRLPFVHQEP